MRMIGWWFLIGAEGKNEEEEYKFFDSPWLALVKTCAMFVGELEFSNLPIGKRSRFDASQWEQSPMFQSANMNLYLTEHLIQSIHFISMKVFG
jgi:hypothetical protein